LEKGLIVKVQTSAETLRDLLKLAQRDFKDSTAAEISDDRRFATAYGAALNIATYYLHQKGYRVPARSGHHELTFDTLRELLPPEAQHFARFFNSARKKRNKIDYHQCDVVSAHEAEELAQVAREFKEWVLGEVNR